MDVKTRIRDYFSKAIPEAIGDEDDIFELGVVNSLFAIQLVLFVENAFSVIAERQDLDIKNFRSISALTSFVLGKIGGAAGVELGHEHPTD